MKPLRLVIAAALVAASTAVLFALIVQARHSSAPTVKKDSKCASRYEIWMTFASPDSSMPYISMNSAASAGGSSANSISSLPARLTASALAPRRAFVAVTRASAAGPGSSTLNSTSSGLSVSRP